MKLRLIQTHTYGFDRLLRRYLRLSTHFKTKRG